MNDRLPSGLEVGSLLRRVSAAGDFATVLKTGDKDRGALLIVVASRGRHVACLERMLAPDGTYRWAESGPADSKGSEQLAAFLAKRTRFDDDLWLIELDVAQPERFIAETTSTS